VLSTGQGARAFAAGEQIYFLRNDRGLGVKNGTLGAIEKIEGTRLMVRLSGKAARAAAFDLADYSDIDHGYAATIHKNQGVTVDRAHVLATRDMDWHLAYFALTRNRLGMQMHWSLDEFGSRKELAVRLSRERAKDVSLDYAEDPLAAYAERRELHADPAPDEGTKMGAAPTQATRLDELMERLTRDPGAARRSLRRPGLAQALRPLLPVLARTIERQEDVAAAKEATAAVREKAAAAATQREAALFHGRNAPLRALINPVSEKKPAAAPDHASADLAARLASFEATRLEPRREAAQLEQLDEPHGSLAETAGAGRG
jgi:hypothetical protein